MIEREVLRPADVAPLLGVTTGRVYQLIAKGILPAVRVGGSLRIPRAAWERWLDQQTSRALAAVASKPKQAARTGQGR